LDIQPFQSDAHGYIGTLAVYVPAGTTVVAGGIYARSDFRVCPAEATMAVHLRTGNAVAALENEKPAAISIGRALYHPVTLNYSASLAGAELS
jgi:hypothetical protein